MHHCDSPGHMYWQGIFRFRIASVADDVPQNDTLVRCLCVATVLLNVFVEIK